MSSGGSGFLGGPTSSDGSIQSAYNFLDPGNILGRSNSGDIAANFLDPGNLLGMNPKANPLLNGQAPQGLGATLSLPAPSGNVNPIFYSPSSFAPRQASGPGAYNAMAAQLAGPVYLPQMLRPAAAKAAISAPALRPVQIPPQGMAR